MKQPDDHGRERISLLSRGSREQLRVAIVLISVIPILSLCGLGMALLWYPEVHSTVNVAVILAVTVFLALLGYMLLLKYPRTIECLRHYLKEIAEGDLPDAIELPDREDDLQAIEGYLNRILNDLRARVKQLQNQLQLSRKMQQTIETQNEELMAAERQRVMIESLGAACHHIGQPATVLRIGLDDLRKQTTDAQARERIDACLDAMRKIGEILEKLRRVSQYRTVPYHVPRDAGDGADKNGHILDIDQT